MGPRKSTSVSQEIAKSLVREGGYPKADIAVEFTLRLGTRKPRADLVVFIERQGANLFFQLISRRYEKGPMILTSNQSFGAWREVFGDRVIATAILAGSTVVPGCT